jgi:NADPH:quinone reductase-like Zn-dependent oxidoreductase
VLPVAYGEGVAERITSVAEGRKVDAFVDTFGASYVELALQLGVRPERIDTIANFEAVAKYGVKAEGNAAAANAEVLAELADSLAQRALEIPIARVYPLDEVQEAYREVEQRHTLGKIVLVP